MNNLSKILSFSTLGTLCAFLLQLISVRLLNMYDYGILGKWLTDLTFFSLFFIFGLDNALLYFSKNTNKFNDNLKLNIFFFSILVFIFGVVSYICNDIRFLYLVVSCYFLALIQSQNAANQLQENFTKYGLINLIKNLLPFIIFLLIYIFLNKITIDEYLKIYTVSVFLAFLFTIRNSFISFENFFNIKNYFFKEYFVFGWKSMMNTFLAILLYSSTMYFLNYYQSVESIAIFFASTTLAKLAWVIPDSIGNILYPKFLNINIKYTKEDVFEETYFFAQLNFILNILTILIFILFGEFFINLIYSPKYSQMFLIVIVLLIGNQGMVYYKILGRYLASINEWKIQRLALFFGILSNFLFNLVLTKTWGLLGAAIATSISFWVCGVIMAFSVKGSLIEFISFNKIIGKTVKC